MKEGIHPEYREVCFVDLSNGFKFVTRSCAQTRENDHDGRRPRAAAATSSRSTSESHPFYTGTQKSVDSLGGRVEKFRNKFAHLEHQEVSRSQAPAERQLRLPFLRPLRPGRRGFCCIIRRAPHAARVNSPNPALVSQREAEPLPRLRAASASAPPTCCPACSAATRGRAPTSPRSATSSTSPQGQTSWLAPTVGGLPRRRRAAAVLDRRGLRQGAAAGSTRPWRRASRSRCCSR